jgi:ligand-binding sensor domain-containing protein/two-component sensor histidine kinase
MFGTKNTFTNIDFICHHMFTKPVHNNHFRVFAFFFCLFFASFYAGAQYNEDNFILHSKKNGLTNNMVTGLVQDNAGYIWISTFKGLNRYDGTAFFPVYLKQFNCFDDYGAVTRMKYFGNNEIGIATNNGGYSFNTLTLKSKAFLVPPLFGGSATFNKCRDIDRSGDGMYATSTGTGFYVFNNNGKLVIRKDAFTSKDAGTGWFQFGNNIQRLKDGSLLQQNKNSDFIYDASEKKIVTLCEKIVNLHQKKFFTPKNNLTERHFLITKQNMLYVLNSENNSLDRYDNFYCPQLIQSLVLPFNVKNEINWQSGFYHLSDTSIAITLQTKGFYIIRINAITHKATADTTRYFSHHFCTALLIDNNKNLWVGTDKGLLQKKAAPPVCNSIDLQPYSRLALTPVIKAIYADGDRLFTGGRNFGQLLVLDAVTKKVIRKISFNAIDEVCNNVISIASFNTDTLCIGTDNGLLWLHKTNFSFGRFTTYNYPAAVINLSNRLSYIDSRKNCWFVTNEYNTVFYFNPNDKKFHLVTPVTAGPKFKIAVCFGVGEDAAGNIWFGGDGICRWNPVTERCDSVMDHIPGVTNNYAAANIFYTDAEKNIWLSSSTGIYKWNAVKGTGKLFTVANGLPDNIVIAHPPPGNDTKLFMHTNYGLAIMDTRNYNIIILNQKDGLPDVNITGYMAYAENKMNKEYLFGYAGNLLALPVNFKKNTNGPFSLNISSINILQDTILYHPGNKVTLKYNQNDIGVSFNAVNFSDADNQVFAYRLLKEKESDWITTYHQNTIYLNNLTQGTYHLQVKVMAANKRWPGQVQELVIIINPPFWETGWFILLLATFIAAIVFAVIKNRIKNIRQKANLDKLLAQTEMKALHAQMNPHFIFNCLNSINEMILLNENAQASKYLSKFAHLIRITLEHSTQAWTSLRHTIDYLHRYLEMESIRTSQFKYQMHIDEQLDIDDTFLPPMLIQPLIENAIWHGIRKGELLLIDISFQKKEHALFCIVSDNGRGIENSIKEKEQKQHKSIGILNIQQRIQLLNEKYNLHSELAIEDRKNMNEQGTCAILKLPLKNPEL